MDHSPGRASIGGWVRALWRRWRGGRIAALPLASLAAVLCATGDPLAAQAIYRCDDGKGGVLYSDSPCKQGVKVDLMPGKADPAAVERLEREQRAFEARQAARDARAEREAMALRAEREADRQRQFDAALLASQAPADSYLWGGVWPTYPVVPIGPPLRPVRPRPEPPPNPGYLPATPRLASPTSQTAKPPTKPPVRPQARVLVPAS